MNIFRWFLFNGLFATGMYYAFYVGVEGALNVVIFYAWFGFVISLCALHESCVNAFREKLKSPAWLMPRHIDVIFDFSIVCVFVWYGHLFTGVAYLIHIFFIAAAWEKAKEPQEDQSEAES